MKKNLIILLLTLLFWTTSFSQTMIEVLHPADADIVLLQVRDSSIVDVVICITHDSKKARQWDCMWKFKKWGTANFAVFLTSDTLELYANDESTLEEEIKYYHPHAKVYFTVHEDEKGYRSELFNIPGIMRVRRNN